NFRFFVIIKLNCMYLKRAIPVLISFMLMVTISASAQYLSKEPPENKNMKPEQTEYYEPVPPVVTPGNTCGSAPSDSIILFDGTNLNQWVSSKDGGEAPWTVADGVMTVKPGTGGIQTKASFGSCQLHIEWRTPSPARGQGQDRG